MEHKVLDSVIDTIYTLGSQNMPLRGHRDDSKYYDDKGNNPGNFQVMLEYHARSEDTVLAQHLKRTKAKMGVEIVLTDQKLYRMR